MGNRALRKQAAKLMKEKGIGKLYYGNKNVSHRTLSAADLRRMIFLLSLKPGDLVNDCDAFNHRFAKYVDAGYSRCFSRYSRTKSYTRTWWCDQVEFEDGGWSCGCPASPCEPYTVAQIENFHAPNTEAEAMAKEGGWWTEADEAKKAALLSGQPITDEHGIILEQFKRKYFEVKNDA